MNKTISCTINGEERLITKDGTSRLLDYLREDLHLTAVKEGCCEGECGACSVIIDNKLINSCMVPIGSVHGKKIETLDWLREQPQATCLIEAFADSGAVQCGFCTPGMVLASLVLLRKNPKPSIDEIKIALSGNLCRCTGYDMIIKGVLLASERGVGIWN